MTQNIPKLQELNNDLLEVKKFFQENLKKIDKAVHIYTHLDADGLSAGGILGKALFREKIPFQIRVLRQLEKEEIVKIKSEIKNSNTILLFSDFGSGQYLELLNVLDNSTPFIIFDHHLPQKVKNSEDIKINEVYKNTRPWHINPYFYQIDGSSDVSGAGMCYLFAKTLSKKNIDLSPIALIGATGDIQNRGPNNSFQGINSIILEDAKNSNLVEIADDLNFSPIKPLNEAIAYASHIELPGLSGNTSKTLKFLKKLGILMEDSEGNIRTLNDLDQDEKREISSKIIEYASITLDIDPSDIIDRLFIDRYVLKKEEKDSELHDFSDFSNLLNSCGRTNNASLGIALAMGDRRFAYQKAKKALNDYRKLLLEALRWIQDNDRIQYKDTIQYFLGEDVISDIIVGPICTLLIKDKFGIIDQSKPIFGCARRIDEDVYKISARASEEIVKKGVNLSEAIREALTLCNLEPLGGGHPPAAGTKVPTDKLDKFLTNCDMIIKKQLND